jgi:hypothetical protein
MTRDVCDLDARLHGRAQCVMSRYKSFTVGNEHDWGGFISVGCSFIFAGLCPCWIGAERMPENKAMSVSLSANLPPARLDALTRDLARDLARTGAVRAAPTEAPIGEGERGVASKIGELVLEALGGAGVKVAAEAAKSVAEVLKAYLLREKSLKIVLKQPDGTTVDIDAKNFSVDAITAALAAAGRAKA